MKQLIFKRLRNINYVTIERNYKVLFENDIAYFIKDDENYLLSCWKSKQQDFEYVIVSRKEKLKRILK